MAGRVGPSQRLVVDGLGGFEPANTQPPVPAFLSWSTIESWTFVGAPVTMD